MPFTASSHPASLGRHAINESWDDIEAQSLDNANHILSFSDICKILLAILLPPIGVFLERGCGADLLINILLTILGYIPGIIHALYIILKY
ncbi:uncharacterized protein Triagg1_7062 [Trichoderma aggressivum f. europaeum]|uniref:Plasma membrane proteolipid 3 n=1 Tax=Trichoderma aggressivum f. europaeum TaxID=173218 RepID=A0AAE1IAB2_9HYPO|nr:hypothetical protein Triagg1_7062 [Trichoderma aggressivum f. europaeum]